MRKKFYFFMLILLNTNNVFGQIYDENVANGCDFDDTAFNMRAKFEPNQHVCSAEYYMPAGYDGCVKCPTGYSCKGGTFTFNENEAQGIVPVTPIRSRILQGCSQDVILDLSSNDNEYNFVATFEPNSHTCNPGYYLPAGVDACTLCPVNSACAGGTYSFNENVSQGIVACDETFAPIGSAVCYQHILHVGDDIVYLRDNKLTTPSLNIQIGNDIFYANMTTTSTYMNKDSTHYLHILYEGDDYYVCDDTTYVAPSE